MPEPFLVRTEEQARDVGQMRGSSKLEHRVQLTSLVSLGQALGLLKSLLPGSILRVLSVRRRKQAELTRQPGAPSLQPGSPLLTGLATNLV